ncbi:MAG TPA: FG-GAP-like repeat-containing protein [Thermoanaerobaculia bacterium]|jgi:hypothetical protein
MRARNTLVCGLVFAFGTAATVVSAPLRVANACAPDVFLQAPHLPVGTGPEGVAVADFNGDEIPDIAVTGDGFAVVVFLGVGDGTFVPQAQIDGSGQSIVSADFDGDGAMDLAVGRPFNVDVYRGHGDGQFDPPVTYPVSADVSHFLVAGDLNHDDKPDLVTNDAADVSVLLNLGNGTFGVASQYPGGNPFGTVFAATIGDADGDGEPDIVAFGSTLAILSNDGTGRFAPPRILVPAFGTGVAIGDVDGDGTSDIVIAEGEPGAPDSGGFVAILLGSGGGSYLAPVETWVGDSPNGLILRDLDGDGVLDAAVVRDQYFGSSFVGVVRGESSAAFSAANQYFAGDGARALATGDFDGDGQVDFVTANVTGGDITLLFGNGAARLRSATGVQPMFDPNLAVTGDFDGDGVLDIVAAGPRSDEGAVAFFHGNGDGTYAVPAFVPANGLNGLAAADFNGDGKLDLAVGGPAGFDATIVFLGNGDGTFREVFRDGDLFATGTGDFNGDGIPDLLGDLGSNNEIVLTFGVGDGTFTGFYTIGLSSPDSALTPFDIDGDGHTDLAFYQLPDPSTPTDPALLQVFLSNGDGTVRFAYNRATVSDPSRIFFADITGDGKADLLTAESEGGTLIATGHGDGTFDDPVVLDTQKSLSVVAADFDGDGVVDIVTTNDLPPTAKFFKGTGGGAFDPPVLVPSSLQAAIAVAPLTGAASDVLMVSGRAFSVLINSQLRPTVSSRSVVVGTAAVLRVAASGYGPLTYQWNRAGVPLSDGGSISGTRTSTLRIDPVGFADGGLGDYDVSVTDDCGTVSSNPVVLSVEFADVPLDSPFHDDIHEIATRGIAAGCGNGNYCPTAPVLREEVAVFLLKAQHGPDYQPPACSGVFSDVPCPGPFTNWIEQLALQGVTGGCGGGNFCPERPVSRAEVAVFLLKTLNGENYTPPAATGIFEDVPIGSFAADFIEALYNQGITGGCALSPLRYCPDDAVLREQIATFLVRTFP